ncbi:MAG: glycoside hydrolase family 20 zincin-like fold domain-containing protein, partial [Spirosomataceae bacterium]
MKKVFSLLYLLVWASSSFSFAQQHTLIPTPVSYQSTGSFFVLANQLTLDIQTNQPAVLKAMTTFERSLQKRNVTLSKSLDTKKKGKILEVKLLKEANVRLGNEGYLLTIDETKISLAANEPAGIFYGIQSLHQLLPPDFANTTSEIRIPTCQIIDYPRFGWRGLMVDVSRHFRTKQEMKDFIDQMVQYKFNVLHWHLTDD